MGNIRSAQDCHGATKGVAGYPNLVGGVGVDKGREVVLHSLVPQATESIVEVLRHFSSSYPSGLKWEYNIWRLPYMVLKHSLISFHDQLDVSVGTSVRHDDSLVRMGDSRESRTLVQEGHITEDLQLAFQLQEGVISYIHRLTVPLVKVLAIQVAGLVE